MRTVRRVIIAWALTALVLLAGVATWDWLHGGKVYAYSWQMRTNASSPGVADQYDWRTTEFRKNRLGQIFKGGKRVKEIKADAKYVGNFSVAGKHRRLYLMFGGASLFLLVTGIAMTPRGSKEVRSA